MSRRFEGFSDRIKAAPLASGSHVDDEQETPGDEPTNLNMKEEPMTEEASSEAISAATEAGHTAGFQAATDRMTAVFASEHYEGREASAGKLLTKSSLASASAEDICDLLADMPKTEQASALTEEQQREAAEEAARNEMREELGKGKNSDLNAGGGNSPGTAKDSSAVWDAAIARVAPNAK